MHKVHRLALLFALILIASCAGPRDPNRPHGPEVWWQEGKTPKDAKMALAEAEALATGHSNPLDVANGGMFLWSAMNKGQFIKKWMESKGYEPRRASTVPDGFQYPEK